jgi:fatty-acyl-CoA synthase
VSPVEVVHALASVADIAEFAVAGVPDVQWGQVVTAVAGLQPGANAPTVDELRASYDGRLSTFKQSRRIAVVDALPRTAATGQVQRTLIVERL